MFSGLGQIPDQLTAFWAQLKPAQRIAFVSIVLVTAGAIAMLFSIANRPDYTTLFANLTPEDAARIVDELSSKNVPFELTHAGTVVQVPVERVYDLRLELAAKGLPESGPVGFEVFDQGSLAMTPFQQQIQYRRALEGELARTISRLGPVRWARVHINIPNKTAFQREQRDPTAAVVLGLAPGQTLSNSDAAGISQLIAGAVENLDARQITIVDEKGRLLARPGGDEGDMLAAGVLDMQRAVETRLGERAQAMLDAALGTGRAVVTVSAAIDRKRFEEKQERVNPDESAIVSEQRTEEQRTTPGLSSAGIPGTASNLPGGATPGVSNDSGNESVTREVTNYEFTRSKSQTVVPMGEIQRLSIAVLVDGTYVAPPVGADGTTPEDAQPVYTPRTPEEIATYTDIVKRAVGFSEQRGDEIVLQNLPFRSPIDEIGSEPAATIWENPMVHLLLPQVSRFLLVIVGLVLLITMVIRPALTQLASLPAVASGGGALTASGATSGGEAGPVNTPRIVDPDAELAIPISKDQAKVVAEALRSWLRE